jgi:hypothetical protein
MPAAVYPESVEGAAMANFRFDQRQGISPIPERDIESSLRRQLRRTNSRRELRQSFGVLEQYALHFLNSFWMALHRMAGGNNLFRFDAVDMCARIFYDSVAAFRRRAPVFNPTMEWATTPSAMGIAINPG